MFSVYSYLCMRMIEYTAVMYVAFGLCVNLKWFDICRFCSLYTMIDLIRLSIPV